MDDQQERKDFLDSVGQPAGRGRELKDFKHLISARIFNYPPPRSNGQQAVEHLEPQMLESVE